MKGTSCQETWQLQCETSSKVRECKYKYNLSFYTSLKPHDMLQMCGTIEQHPYIATWVQS